MPVYEYLCSACANRYEKRESFSAPARQKCPRCRKAANRILQAPPIVFKGSGFYATDSRGSNGSAEPATAVSDSTADSSTTSESSSTETAAAS